MSRDHPVAERAQDTGSHRLNLWLVFEWLGADLGALNTEVTFRYVLWGFTALVLGVQTIYGSFFLSMLGTRADERPIPGEAA